MDFSKLPLIALMSRKLAWLGARSSVLAQNVANADTPGYAARDLKPFDFRAELVRATQAPTSGRLAGSDRRHLPAGTGIVAANSPAIEAEPRPFETTLSGNSVSLEQQMGKLGETQLAYQTAIELYRKHLAMIRTAIGRGN